MYMVYRATQMGSAFVAVRHCLDHLSSKHLSKQPISQVSWGSGYMVLDSILFFSFHLTLSPFFYFDGCNMYNEFGFC